MTNAICIQEQYLSGFLAPDGDRRVSMAEKWDLAQQWGFDGIELRAQGAGAFAARLPELREAAAAGIPMPTVCVEMAHFIGAFDDALRADAREQLRQQLRVMAEIGGRGAMTPASWGMFSRRLPPFEPPRTPDQDRAVLEDALGDLGTEAATLGVAVFLEPLNRYEDHMVNRLADAVAIIESVGLESVQIGADTYHMNIEEADPAAALLAAAPHIGHVQASDSNRLEPGAGHVDWPLLCATLVAIGYDGPIALESRLSGPADEVLPRVAPLLRRFL